MLHDFRVRERAAVASFLYCVRSEWVVLYRVDEVDIACLKMFLAFHISCPHFSKIVE